MDSAAGQSMPRKADAVGAITRKEIGGQSLGISDVPARIEVSDKSGRIGGCYQSLLPFAGSGPIVPAISFHHLRCRLISDQEPAPPASCSVSYVQSRILNY